MKKLRLILAMSMVLALQGCLVTSAVDLAATTVLTAGKLAVKATGAVIDMAIPDGDDDDEKKEKNKDKKEKQEKSED